ncbi:unnamed protein product [Trichobilharzia regenti]|nr:unnamed protein product [Trichobilharzia regenti]
MGIGRIGHHGQLVRVLADSGFCPESDITQNPTWSEWSSWSECEPDCSSNAQISEIGGIRRRERTCTLVSTENDLTRSSSVLPSHGCPGPTEEIQDCVLEHKVSGATNGHRVMGTSNGVTWESVGQFADGSMIQMSQRVSRTNESYGVSLTESIIHLNTDIHLSGSCTFSLIDSKTTSNPEVELHDFHEDLVQLSPQKGSLHGHSSRAFTVYNLEREKSQMEPYSWTSTIRIGPDRRQNYLTQELQVDGIEHKANLQAGQIEFRAEGIIKKPLGPEVCPSGFEIQQARVTGPGMRLQSRRDYCKGKFIIAVYVVVFSGLDS